MRSCRHIQPVFFKTQPCVSICSPCWCAHSGVTCVTSASAGVLRGHVLSADAAAAATPPQFSHTSEVSVIPAVIFAVNWIKGWINFYCLFHRVAVTKSSWCSRGVVKMFLLKKKWCFVFFGWSRANKTENYRLLRPRCTTTLFSFCPKSTYPLEPGERFG